MAETMAADDGEYLVVQVPPDWTQDEVDSILDAMDATTPDGVRTVVVPSEVGFMDEESLEQFANDILDTIDA